MNKLKTTGNGGFPFDLNDLRFEQDAVRDAFYGFLSGIGVAAVDSFILSGCAVTDNGSYYSVAAGYISLNGEILRVEAHNYNKTGGHTYYWLLDVTYDPDGNEAFENGSSYDTYEVRRGKLTSSVSPTAGTYLPMAAKTLMQKIYDLAAKTADDALAASIAAVNSALTASIAALNTSTSASIGSLNSSISAINTAINTLNTTVGGHATSISTLNSSVSTINSQIATINGAWASSAIDLADFTGSGGGVSAGSGTFRYKIIGKTMHFYLAGSLTLTGTNIGFSIDVGNSFLSAFSASIFGSMEGAGARAITRCYCNNNSHVIGFLPTGASTTFAADTYAFYAAGTISIL